MAPYCFTRQRDLFAEAAARGWLRAILDFPRMLAAHEEVEMVAQIAPDELREETCCIEDDYGYRLLVISAWASGYRALTQQTERDIAIMVSVLKPLPTDEALVRLHHGFDDQSTAVDDAYAQFQELCGKVG